MNHFTQLSTALASPAASETGMAQLRAGPAPAVPLSGGSGDSRSGGVLLRSEVLFGDRLFNCFAERPKSVYALWQRSVMQHPTKDAVIYGAERWTYAQADAQARAIESGLRAEGIQPGDRVAILLGNQPLYVFCLIALQRLGAIAVPIGTREQRAGVAYMLNQCAAKGIVFDAELSDRIPDAAEAPKLHLRVVSGESAQYRRIDELLALGARSPSGAPANVDEEDTAVILYTSGTTGKPKGAMLTHVNIAHSVRHLELALRLSHEDRVALTLPISHVSGLVTVLLTTLNVGATEGVPNFV